MYIYYGLQVLRPYNYQLGDIVLYKQKFDAQKQCEVGFVSRIGGLSITVAPASNAYVCMPLRLSLLAISLPIYIYFIQCNVFLYFLRRSYLNIHSLYIYIYMC